MHIAVLNDKGALGIEKILNAKTALRIELSFSTQFRRVSVDRSFKNSCTRIEKWNHAPFGFSVQAEEERVTNQKAARMDSTAQHSLADHAKATDRKPRSVKIPYGQTNARLCNQQGNV